MPTDAERRAARKWEATKIDKMTVRAPKGTKELIGQCARLHGMSTNSYINELIQKAIKENLNIQNEDD